jgi:hypothetical protein
LGFQLQAQKILFVGNSLTYTNNMPFMLEKIGAIYNKGIIVKSISKPNYAIVDHLNEGTIQQKIATENYDYVIIQQGPSSQEEGRKMLLNDGKKIAEICSKHNTKLAYFMVWPSKRYYFTFDKVIANYTNAAKANNALLFPVGVYWKEYQKLKNKTSLYDLDQFHPSKAGSFLAALTIFKQLYPKDNLKKLHYNKVNFWVENKESFNTIIDLIEN